MTGTTTATRPARAPERRPPRRTRASARGGGGRLATWLGTWQAELLLVAALVALALAVRWPHLLRFPRFTDETLEIRWAVAIWRGEMLPLTAADPYYGPLHAYLVAACLWLFGPSILLPRAISLVFGALTVATTYLLGRELAGKAVGLLAAALLITAPQHIIVNSHVAWENSTTPFFSTLCFWALARALRHLRCPQPGQPGAPDGPSRGWSRAGGWLVLSGFLYGLTLHTHPGMIVLAPGLTGALLYTLHARRAWRLLRTPWPYAAVGLGVLTYSPVLIYNVIHWLAAVGNVKRRHTYAYELSPTWDSYRENLGNLLLGLARVISDPTWLPARPAQYLTSPYLVATVALALTGLVLLTRRGQVLPLFALVSTVAILPYFNQSYGQAGDFPLIPGRYITYLVPLADIAIALAALTLAGMALARVPRYWRGLPTRELAAIAPAVLLGALVLYPLLPLARYYAREEATNPDNASYLETVRLINEVRGPRTPVLVDTYFDRVVFIEGVEALDVITYLLFLDGVPHRRVDDVGAAIQELAPTIDPDDPETLPIVVMTRDRCFRLPDSVPLQRISERLRLTQLYRDHPSYYGVYRYAPSQQAGCFEATGPQPGD